MATDQHWLAVDDSAQLALLDQLVLQDQESSLVEAYGWHGHEDYFPPDISRDGYRHINWRLLLRTWTAQEYVEVVADRVRVHHRQLAVVALFPWPGRFASSCRAVWGR